MRKTERFITDTDYSNSKWIGFYQICLPILPGVALEIPINRNESQGFASVFIQIHDPPLVALACPTSFPDPACSGQHGPPRLRE